MRQIIIFISLGFFLCTQACNTSSNEAARLRFLVPLDLDGGLGTVQTHVFRVFDVPTLFEETINTSNITLESITQIQSSFGSFAGKFESIDLNFIDGMTVHILEDATTGDRTELFYLDVVPLGNKTEIKLLASTSELKDLLSQETIDLELSLRFRQFLSQNFTGEFDLSFGIFVD